MNISKYQEQCAVSINNYRKNVGTMPYVENGIFLWEGFAFCAMLDFYNIDLIIESGIAGGRSTEIWAKYSARPVYAIDHSKYYGKQRFNQTRDRLSKYKNVTVINGDAFLVVEKIIKRNINLSVAVFIDGPKGEAAILLGKQCIKYPNVKFVSIHDMCKRSNYHLMDEWCSKSFYSDAEWFLREYSYLDMEIPDVSFKQEYSKNSVGPGLGFAFADTALKKITIVDLVNYWRLKLAAVLHGIIDNK